MIGSETLGPLLLVAGSCKAAQQLSLTSHDFAQVLTLRVLGPYV